MARKILDTKKATHEEWLETRKHSIGGSDAGTVMGMNPYSSLITLYANKTGMSKDIEDNEAMRLGRDLEEYVAMRFSEATGKSVRRDNFMYADDEYEFLTANVDRKVVGENAGLECKTMGNGSAKYDFDAGEVPGHYFCQCQHYMMVMGWEKVYLTILVLQRGVHVVTIDRDDAFIEAMREREVDFWKNNVEAGVIPAPDGSEASLDTLKELYPTAVPETSVEIFGLDQMVEDYIAADDMAKHYEEIKNRLKGEICAKLGDREIGQGNAYSVSWKTQSKTDIDKTMLRSLYPDVYKNCMKTSTFRVFRKKKMSKKGA